MASRASRPPASVGQLVEEVLVLDVLQEGHHLRMRADHVGDVQERQPHLRRDVVGDGLRERVGRVLLAQPRLQLLVEPPRGLHRPHEHLMAPRIEQDPLQLLDVRQDEVEQRRSGLRPDVALQGGDGRLAALDQLGDDGRIGLDRRPARRRPAARRDPRPGATGRSRRGRGWSAARPRSADRPSPGPPGGRARLAGEARRWATSTNSLPPASYIRGRAVSCHSGEPQGLHGVGHHLLVTDGDVDVVLSVVGVGDGEQRGDRPALDDLEAVVDQAPFDVLRAAEVRFDPPAELHEPRRPARPSAPAAVPAAARSPWRRPRRRAPCRRPAFTRPETRASPRPKPASTEATFRLDVTGSAVKRTPAACGKTICCTTTAMWTFRWSKPLRRR